MRHSRASPAKPNLADFLVGSCSLELRGEALGIERLASGSQDREHGGGLFDCAQGK
jgi:hypothetical protein